MKHLTPIGVEEVIKHKLKVTKDNNGLTVVTLDGKDLITKSIQLNRKVNEPTTAMIEIFIDDVYWKEEYKGDFK